MKTGRVGHDGTGWPRLCTARARAVNNGGNKSARRLAALFRDKRRREWEQRPSTRTMNPPCDNCIWAYLCKLKARLVVRSMVRGHVSASAAW